MINYRPIEEVIRHPGLRLVLVRGMPSPWGQATKAMFELKKLDFVVAPQEMGGPNEALVAWSGQNSAPVVAWAQEPPLTRWIDILLLSERLAPSPALIPENPSERALMIGLSHEVCGENGVGWNRRVQMFEPAMKSGQAPEPVLQMAKKYRYTDEDTKIAGQRTAENLTALSAQLKAQYSKGRTFFVGDRLSALDMYWVTFANLLDPLPAEHCPIPEAWRPGFVVSDPVVRAALDPLLLEHRDRIFKAYFRSPMEL